MRMVVAAVKVSVIICGMVGLLCNSHLHGQGSSLLHLEDRIEVQSRLIGVREDNWVFQIDDEKRDEVLQPVRWGKWPGLVDQQAVLLTDGSWIVADILERTPEALRIQTRWLDLLEIPLTAVRAVLVTPAASLEEWILIQQRLSEVRGEDDIVWLRDDNRLSGILDWLPANNREEESIQVTAGQGEVLIPWTDIRLIAVSPALIGPVPENLNVTRIGLEDGTLLNATDVKSQDRSVAIRILPLDIRSQDSPEVFSQAISYLGTDRLANGVRADQIKPTSYRFLPDSELRYELGVNQSVFGRPLVIGHRGDAGIVLRGLALHGASQVAYRWDQSPGRFLSEVRMAAQKEDGSQLGNVNCKVLVVKDRELIPVIEFSLGRQDGMPEFKAVDVEITGAQLVVLVVEKGLLGQWGDEVYWLDARFSRN